MQRDPMPQSQIERQQLIHSLTSRDNPFDNTLNRLSDAFYKLDIKPIKPYIGRGCHHGQGRGHTPGRQYDFHSSGGVTFTRGFSRPRRRGKPQRGNFNKSLTQKMCRVASKAKWTERCRYCKQLRRTAQRRRMPEILSRHIKSEHIKNVTTMEKKRALEAMVKYISGLMKSTQKTPSTPWMTSHHLMTKMRNPYGLFRLIMVMIFALYHCPQENP